MDVKTQVHDAELSEGIMRRGLPRPVFDLQTTPWMNQRPRRFLPAPYSASTDVISVISETRASECLRDVVCSVCGDEVDFNDQGYITVLLKNNHLTYESGPFHPKCATMTMNFCPHIAKSTEWSVAMVPMELWIRQQEYWLNGEGRMSAYAPGIPLSCQ